MCGRPGGEHNLMSLMYCWAVERDVNSARVTKHPDPSACSSTSNKEGVWKRSRGVADVFQRSVVWGMVKDAGGGGRSAVVF